MQENSTEVKPIVWTALHARATTAYVPLKTRRPQKLVTVEFMVLPVEKNPN